MAPVCRLRLFRAIEPALPAVRLQPRLLLLLCALCGSGCGGRQFVRCRGLFGRFGGRDYGSFDRVQALVDPDGSRRRWRFSGCRVAALRSGRWCRGPDGCTQRAAAPAGECRSRGAAGRSARLRHRTIEIDRARNFAPYFVYSIFANCFFHRSPTGWFGSMHPGLLLSIYGRLPCRVCSPPLALGTRQEPARFSYAEEAIALFCSSQRELSKWAYRLLALLARETRAAAGALPIRRAGLLLAYPLRTRLFSLSNSPWMRSSAVFKPFSFWISSSSSRL